MLSIDPTRALGRYDPKAVGLNELRKGFAVSPAWDALFALGFPHLRFIDEAPPASMDPRKAAEQAVRAIDPDAFPHAFPAAAVPRYLRASAIHKNRAAQHAAALDDGRPYAREEAPKRIALLVDPANLGYEFVVDDVLYLIEALFGTAFVVDALLRIFEGRPAKVWMKSEQTSAGAAVTACGFLLRRLPPPGAAAARKRLEKLAAKPMDEDLKERFDLMLGGAEAYWRILIDAGRPEGFVFAVHAGDPALYARLAKNARDAWQLDPWFVFRGGDAVLKLWPSAIAGADAWRHERLAIELGLMKSKAVGPCMKALLKKKAAAPIAQAWFKAGGKAPALPAAKKRPEAVVEKDFDVLAADTATALDRARGDRQKERRVLEAAAKRYAELRGELGQPGREALVTFFGDDGVAIGKSRKAALQRIRSTDEEFARWTRILESLA